jgi:hypothetical protein
MRVEVRSRTVGDDSSESGTIPVDPKGEKSLFGGSLVAAHDGERDGGRLGVSI